MRSFLVALLALPLVACDAPVPAPSPAASASAVVSAPPAPSAAAPAVPTASAAPKVESPAPETIAAQHVLVAYKGAKNAPKGVTRSKADAKERAAEVLGKAKGGTDFSELVASYSDDPAAKERQGSVGKIKPSNVVKPFADAAFALPVDGVSEVVETEFGFHVIKRNQ